jgi:hypothetical protein
MALSNAEKLVNLGMPTQLAQAVQDMIAAAVLGTGAVSNVNVAADAAIATSKLADGTELAALVAVETELSAVAAAAATPAAYSVVAADLAAALVNAGLMEPEA